MRTELSLNRAAVAARVGPFTAARCDVSDYTRFVNKGLLTVYSLMGYYSSTSKEVKYDKSTIRKVVEGSHIY